jgi:hypothetical protein
MPSRRWQRRLRQKTYYHGADSTAVLLGRMQNRFLCVCRSGVGGRLIWNRLSGDQSLLNQFHLDFSEFLSPQIAPLSCLILPKLSTLVDCCLGWMAQHLQAFCMLLATHRHHIVAVPSSSSNRRRPIAVLESPLPSPLPYYIDESIVVVTMAACADGVLLFPQPTEHVAHHRC